MATIEERISKKGVRSFRALVRVAGYPAKSATFSRKTDAKLWASNIEGEMKRGRYIDSTESKKHTLNMAIDRYLREVLPSKPKNARNVAQHLKWWGETLGSFSLNEITPSRISQTRDQLLAGLSNKGIRRSPSTIVRYLASLSVLLSLCYREWQWIEENPIAKVSKPSEPRGRVRFLDDDERDRLLNECRASSNPYLYTFVVLSMASGMRRGEVMNLRWKDVDLERGRVILHETKNGERRLVPVSGLALELLKGLYAQRNEASTLIFPGTDPHKPIDLRFPWEQALKAAEIKDFRPHDLRHCCASYLAMSGASLAEIAEVLGHKTLTMVKRYAHLSEAHTSAVVAKMTQKYLGAHHEQT